MSVFVLFDDIIFSGEFHWSAFMMSELHKIYSSCLIILFYGY